MRPLIIDLDAKRRIAYATKHALHNPLRLSDRADGFDPWSDPHRLVLFDFGFRAAVTVEEEPSGWVRRLRVGLSVSEGRYPGPDAVDRLLPLFGFKKPLDAVAVDVVEGGLVVVTEEAASGTAS